MSLVKWIHPNCILIIRTYPLPTWSASNLTVSSLNLNRFLAKSYLGKNMYNSAMNICEAVNSDSCQPVETQAVADMNFSQGTMCDLVTLLSTKHVVQQFWITTSLCLSI